MRLSGLVTDRQIPPKRVRELMHVHRYASRVTWTGDEIRRRRLLKGFTQQQLADATGAGRRSIVEWEKADTSPPSGRLLLRLEQTLRLPEDDDTNTGPLLRDAGFVDTMNRLVELHNEQRAHAGLPPVLKVSDAPLPGDLPEHAVAEGPDLNGDNTHPVSPERRSNSENGDRQ